MIFKSILQSVRGISVFIFKIEIKTISFTFKSHITYTENTL